MSRDNARAWSSKVGRPEIDGNRGVTLSTVRVGVGDAVETPGGGSPGLSQRVTRRVILRSMMRRR